MSTARRPGCSFEISFIHAVFFVHFLHDQRVDADERHVDRERTLRRKVERQRKAQERHAAVQVAGEPDLDECEDEPDAEQDRRDDEVLAPVLMVLCGQFQSSLPSRKGTNYAFLLDSRGNPYIKLGGTQTGATLPRRTSRRGNGEMAERVGFEPTKRY